MRSSIYFYNLLVPIKHGTRSEIYFNRETALDQKRRTDGKLILKSYATKKEVEFKQ